MLSCSHASSSAVLTRPCWLFSMVDFLPDTYLRYLRPCGKSGGAFPFLNKPPQYLIEYSFCPSHKITLAQRRFPMSRKTPRRKNHSKVNIGGLDRCRWLVASIMTQCLHANGLHFCPTFKTAPRRQINMVLQPKFSVHMAYYRSLSNTNNDYPCKLFNHVQEPQTQAVVLR